MHQLIIEGTLFKETNMKNSFSFTKLNKPHNYRAFVKDQTHNYLPEIKYIYDSPHHNIFLDSDFTNDEEFWSGINIGVISLFSVDPQINRCFSIFGNAFYDEPKKCIKLYHVRIKSHRGRYISDRENSDPFRRINWFNFFTIKTRKQPLSYHFSFNYHNDNMLPDSTKVIFSVMFFKKSEVDKIHDNFIIYTDNPMLDF